MATLPRYEPMGVQYADLPRVSTAAQQVAAEGFSRLSANLDRMVGFLQSQAETKAQREAKKYAIENPPTQEQINKSIETGQFPQIEGAGEIFQQTYESMAGVMLSSQMQAEGQRRIGQVLEAVKAGGPVNVQQIQSDMKDMIDGYASAVSALDPEESIRLRSRLTLAGNAVFEQAAAAEIKRQMGVVKAARKAEATDSLPGLEAIYLKVGQRDPQTGKPIDVQRMVQSYLRPFLDHANTTGDSEPLNIALANDRKARIGAVAMSLKSPDSSAMQALDILDGRAAGDMQVIYDGMDDATKQSVKDSILKYYADREAAKQQEEARNKILNRDAGIDLRQQYYLGKIGKDELVAGLRRLNDLSPDEQRSIMREETEQNKAPAQTIGILQSLIANGELGEANLDIMAMRGQISYEQRNTLANEARNRGTDFSKGMQYIRAAIGKRTDSFSQATPRNAEREASVVEQYIRAEAEAKAAGKPINYVQVAQDLVKARLDQQDVRAEQEAKDDLRQYLARQKLQYREDWTDEELKKLDIGTTERRTILNKQRAVRGE